MTKKLVEKDADPFDDGAEELGAVAMVVRGAHGIEPPWSVYVWDQARDHLKECPECLGRLRGVLNHLLDMFGKVQ